MNNRILLLTLINKEEELKDNQWLDNYVEYFDYIFLIDGIPRQRYFPYYFDYVKKYPQHLNYKSIDNTDKYLKEYSDKYDNVINIEYLNEFDTREEFINFCLSKIKYKLGDINNIKLYLSNFEKEIDKEVLENNELNLDDKYYSCIFEEDYENVLFIWNGEYMMKHYKPKFMENVYK